MTGTMTKIKKYGKAFFFILGDDGITYFTHRMYLKNGNKDWKYCWNGNKVEFEIKDEGRENLKAIDLLPHPQTDPFRAEKKENAKLEKERSEAKKEIKAQNRAKAEKMKEKADRRRIHRNASEEKLKYVIQKRMGDEWRNVRPYNMYNSLSDAKQRKEVLIQNDQSGNARFRIKKYYVYNVQGRYIFKEPEEWV